MSTIKSSREIDVVFRTARRAAHPLVIALVAQTPPGRDQLGRVAFVAGKRIGNAVTRNRAKRVLRTAAAIAGAPWEGKDVVLVARESTPKSSPTQVAEAISSMMRRAEADR